MHLKHIEVFGFKSFADKTVIAFEPGVTCVVGPNGCGKSNISDAMRWVLGERSAKLLRGSKMEDVIFSGTEFRKPLNMAEVSLAFDNSDHKLPIEYEEVVITRRLHRSGESEYLINKTQCRLKDIYDLILDTGMGSNSYSMIEQGRIDYILNAQPEERRHLIEEAAGISKYKVKKEEALRKLDRTEQNLLRLNDIVSEVERNIKYAERQAKRAEKYKTDLDRLKDLEKKRAVIELNTRTAKLNKLTKDKETLDAELIKLTQDTNNLRQKLNLEDVKLRDLDATFFQEERNRSEVQQKLISHENHEKFNTEKIESIKLSAEKALGEILSLNEQLDRIRVEISSKKQDLLHIKQEYAQLENEKIYEETNLKQLVESPTNVSKSLEEKTRTSFDTAHQLSQLRNQLSVIHSKKYAVSKSEALFQARLEKLHVTKKVLLSKEHEATRAGHLNNGNASEIQTGLDQCEQKKRELASPYRSLKEEIKNLEFQQIKIENEVQLYEKMTERYTHGLTAQTPDGGTIQAFRPLCELIEISPGYELALEAALDSMIRTLVAKDVNTAMDLVLKIKNNDLRRTPILIHEKVSEVLSGEPKNFLQHEQIKGPLIEFINAQAGYSDLFNILFQNTYIVNELTNENVHELTRLASQAKLITRSGTIIKNPFLIEVGNQPYGSEQSEFSNKILFDEAKKKLFSIAEDLTQKKSEFEKMVCLIDNLEHESQDLRSNREQIQLSLEHLKGTHAQFTEQLNQVDAEIQLTKNEALQSGRELDSLSTEEQACEDELRTHEAIEKENNQAVAELRSQLEDFTKEKHAREHQAKHLSTILDMKLQNQKSLESTLELLRTQCENALTRINSLTQERDDAQVKVEQLAQESQSLQAQMNQLSHLLLDSSVRVERVKETRDNLLNQKNDLLNNIQSLDTQRTVQQQNLHQIQLQQVELKHENDATLKELFDRYKIRATDLNEIPVEDALAQLDESHLIRLREKLDTTPNVNLLAIEEYEDLKARFDFLDTQRQDLQNAKESLLEAIRHINRTTKKLFDDTLTAVRERFKKYFQLLFDGGAADLILLDETHPLDSGLDILAKPPGKKLQHISLLSGGEKALTAIALLLSLFSVRPSPFCVLDEVDAPLDEANNERFILALKPFLNTTQFVMITHSRKTISTADALYGVTMQEAGVSTLVSVRLSHTDATIEHSDSHVKKELNQILA